MRVWTVHPLIVWERLNDAGTLNVDPSTYRFGYIDGEAYVPWQYQWMACRLKEQIPGYTGGLPWWAYCEKPDLRWVRHNRPKGQPQVRIELDVENALAFRGWAWNVIHCGHYLAFTLREQEAWHTAMREAVPDVDLWPLPEPWKSELEASWLRLFDPDLPPDGWADVAEKLGSYTDAVFETLHLREVCAVTHFVGNSRWR